jgi:hypothetical protein
MFNNQHFSRIFFCGLTALGSDVWAYYEKLKNGARATVHGGDFWWL